MLIIPFAFIKLCLKTSHVYVVTKYSCIKNIHSDHEYSLKSLYLHSIIMWWVLLGAGIFEEYLLLS